MIQSSCPVVCSAEVSQFKLGDRVRCPYCKSESSAADVCRSPRATQTSAIARPSTTASRTGAWSVFIEGYERFEEVGKGAMGKATKPTSPSCAEKWR